jgi:AcrR family transcriptional regulator
MSGRSLTVARPATISTERILDAARAIFLAEGFGAATAEIARQAGVSEGTLFKRFKTKESLFLAAMQVPEVPPWAQMARELVGRGDARLNLITIASRFTEFLHEVIPPLMLVWGSHVASPRPCAAQEPPQARDRRLFAEYLRGEMDLGRIRTCNPSAVAQVIVSSLGGYVFDTYMLRLSRTGQEEQQFIQELVELVWNGLVPSIPA